MTPVAMPGPQGFEESMALIDALGQQAQEQADRAASLEREVATLTVSRWSPGRQVRVTLSSSGLLQDVEFGPSARARSAAALSRDVLTAIRGAMDDLRALVAEIGGAHDEAGGHGMGGALIAAYDQSLAAPLGQYRPSDKEPMS